MYLTAVPLGTSQLSRTTAHRANAMTTAAITKPLTTFILTTIGPDGILNKPSEPRINSEIPYTRSLAANAIRQARKQGRQVSKYQTSKKVTTYEMTMLVGAKVQVTIDHNVAV